LASDLLAAGDWGAPAWTNLAISAARSIFFKFSHHDQRIELAATPW